MAEILYLDLFFLVNLLADLLLLVLTGLVRKEDMGRRKGRLCVGAAAGALAACLLVFVPAIPLFFWILLELVLPAGVMTRIAFGRCGKAESVRRILTLILMAFLTGGILTALESVLRTRYPFPEIWGLTSWSMGNLGMLFGVSGLLACAGMRTLTQKVLLQNHLYEVILYDQGKQKQVRALQDTGNQLYEPYGHQPVHILEQNVCRELCGEMSGAVCVPFSSVGNEHGILMAVRIDRMEVRQKGKRIRVLERPWIAASETPLSPRHQYEMLLHGEI